MKAFVIMFNRLTWAKQLCEQLVERGFEPILIDNGSTYQPLLDWYMKCPYKVHLLNNTYGHKSGWQSGIIQSYDEKYYAVTDHDLDLSSVPMDTKEYLLNELKRTNYPKVGLSLSIIDLPSNDYAKEVIAWEAKFWWNKNNNGFYESDIDTTFAIYDRDRLNDVESDAFFTALRSPNPYTAKHMPWYNEVGKISEEEKYYMNNLNRCGYWTNKFIQHENNSI